MNKKRWLFALSTVLGLIILVGGYGGYLFVMTPAHMRRPAFEHYHFRTQILVDGEAVNFSDDKFQQATDNNAACSTAVTGVPMDFHDKVDQMAHVHWDGMTGGEFLKYFGWNFIGGDNSSLGYRYDQSMFRPHKVGIFGNLLPARPDNANFYIYTGDANGYQRKDWNSFLNQDLEDFFGKQSSIGETSFNVVDWLFPKAFAHGEEMHEDTGTETKSEEELTRINNLVGNVVVFVQSDEPTNEQIQERFNNLVPLHDSVCGG